MTTAVIAVSVTLLFLQLLKMLLCCMLQAVFKSKGFQEMSEDALCVVLKSDHLMLDEMVIYRAVKEWATVNSVGGFTPTTVAIWEITRLTRHDLHLPCKHL